MDRRVDNLMTVMTADHRQGLSLRKMAQSVNLSMPHLCCIFKTETGTSPRRYFKFAAMEYSAALLSTTFLSVKQVMERAGFNDQSHFVRDFKKIYGKSPTEYRKSAVSVPRAVATGQVSVEDGSNGNGHASVQRVKVQGAKSKVQSSRSVPSLKPKPKSKAQSPKIKVQSPDHKIRQ